MKIVPFLFVVFAACAGQVSPASTALDDSSDAELYAAALREAFTRYEDAINAVRGDEFASEAEAEAVARTLSPAYFDGLLASALAKRGLTVDDLGTFAREHEEFFVEQQARYAGRLEQLDRDRLALATQVAAPEADDDRLASAR
jgi:hypothetical protein